MTAFRKQWLESLEQLFSASVNQQTLEEAAVLIVSVSTVDPLYHAECLNAIDQAIAAATNGDPSVLAAINTSGYQVWTTGDAVTLLNDFRTIYLREFARSRGAG